METLALAIGFVVVGLVFIYIAYKLGYLDGYEAGSNE